MNKITFQLAIFLHLNVMQNNQVTKGNLSLFVTILIMLTDSIGSFGNDQDNKVAYVVSRSVRELLNDVKDVYILDDTLCTQITYLKNRLEKVLKSVPGKKWEAYSAKHAEQLGMLRVKEKEAA